MIYYSMPFDAGKNIGRYYNAFMEALPQEDDWACFADGDTVFTTHDYGLLLEKAVVENPEASCFTCYTNRIGCPWQIAPGVDRGSDDMKYHRQFGEQLKNQFGSSVIDVTVREIKLSGFLFVLKKSAWRAVGGFLEAGMLTVDNDIHRKLEANGHKIYLIQGLYLYHWYRGGDPKDVRHLF